jgi:DNA-binding MarR family transcriptional regulator
VKASRQKQPSEDRAVRGQRLGDAARLASNAADLFDEEVAAFVGINRTDARCIDLIDFHGRVTAGELAQAASVTTGAVTTAVDRLVRAGLAVRERGLDDRRKVYIELSPEGQRLLRALYHPFKAGWVKQGMAFSDEALATMTQYFAISRRMSLAFVDALRELQVGPKATLVQRIAAAEKLSDWRPPSPEVEEPEPVPVGTLRRR